MSEKIRCVGQIADVAALLQVPESVVKYWVFKKRIPYFKVGRSVRFDMEKIEQWIESRQFSQEQDGL